jgi:glycosyltransferase involved in cell wall biosynthesis
MRILWVKTDFLHPTNRGGQIRTLETLRRLHRRNEVHFIAYDDPGTPEGRERASEYSARAYPVNRVIPPRRSPHFFLQLAANILSPLPLAVGRYESDQMKARIRTVLTAHPFDAIVCDFLSSAPNLPDLGKAVLFQHNIESRIWQRHAEHASDMLSRTYFGVQARRMLRCERDFCRRAARVISVSPNDTKDMRELFGVTSISEIATGVDLEYFAPHAQASARWDLVFLGAMDWLPNIDGARYFVSEILPRIRKSLPHVRLVFAGRNPVPEIQAFARSDSQIEVTGTVSDVRPYLWNSLVSIVPLRIGGGTRLKIYEAMAAGIPVVSTSIGAEGLAVTPDRNILLADSADAFASGCIELLRSEARRREQSAAARELVSSRFSWERIASEFEDILNDVRLSLS